ncbi:MAG TPA: type II toxin-antitoxin system HicB family antitoxin [Nitrospirae bacterium]|nr:type II toxin-antitoxin system HicB family antitoxin [Nitrospirota bacterium]
MKDMMEYKGYHGSVHYDEGDRIFFGKVVFIRALVSYEASDAKKFRKSFEDAVDDYICQCEKEGADPERPFKGSFNVRIKPELHRKAALMADKKGISLNKFMAETLEKATK